ncbi:hypothetical protein IWX90DRAFT_419275 [Phyllosticta citrichinensis]|uniref:Uncharacterized protein n=1 Tax=Phyllosticta citrichinensis TaxID=1130410 RepID=A0ABR1XF65_9PEZI
MNREAANLPGEDEHANKAQAIHPGATTINSEMDEVEKGAEGEADTFDQILATSAAKLQLELRKKVTELARAREKASNLLVELEQKLQAEKQAGQARLEKAVQAEKRAGEARLEEAVEAERQAGEEKLERKLAEKDVQYLAEIRRLRDENRRLKNDQNASKAPRNHQLRPMSPVRREALSYCQIRRATGRQGRSETNQQITRDPSEPSRQENMVDHSDLSNQQIKVDPSDSPRQKNEFDHSDASDVEDHKPRIKRQRTSDDEASGQPIPQVPAPIAAAPAAAPAPVFVKEPTTPHERLNEAKTKLNALFLVHGNRMTATVLVERYPGRMQQAEEALKEIRRL